MVSLVGSVANISELCSNNLEFVDVIELRIDLLGEEWKRAIG